MRISLRLGAAGLQVVANGKITLNCLDLERRASFLFSPIKLP